MGSRVERHMGDDRARRARSPALARSPETQTARSEIARRSTKVEAEAEGAPRGKHSLWRDVAQLLTNCFIYCTSLCRALAK